MKRPALRWLAFALVALLLAGGLLRLLSARKEQQDTAARSVAQKAESVVELAASDVVKVQQRELAQGLPVSGSLRAVNSAVVKARVAGELQGLTVREGEFVVGANPGVVDIGTFFSSITKPRNDGPLIAALLAIQHERSGQGDRHGYQ